MKINEPICACPSVVLIKWIIDLLQRELINKYIKEEGCLQHEKLLLSGLITTAIFGLTACGGKSEDKLVVGASNVPHAVILEKAKPLLEKKV